MFNVVTLPVVGLLSASCRPIVPPSSNAASFVLIFLLTFLTFFLRLPFLTVFSFPLSVCPIHFFCLDCIVRMRDLSSSIVSNRAYILICVVFCPADFLRSSQSPRFNSLKSFYIRCPRFWTIQHHTAYQCLYHPYLQCSIYFSSHKFSRLWECLFSYRYSSFNFSVAVEICHNHTH